MGEEFAPEAAAKDKRVQDMAFQDARISVKTITESVAFQPDTAIKRGTEETPVATEKKVQEPTRDQLELIRDDAKAIKDDGASSVDDKGASEIIERVAERQLEEREKEKTKTKVRYSKSRSMFSSIKLFLVPDAVTQPKAHAKMILYSEIKEKHNDYLTATRGFSGGSVVSSNNLLKASAGAANAMAGPVVREVPYGDL